MSKKHEQMARYNRYERALTNAYNAANTAQSGLVENMNAFDCGFAWVVTHDTGFNTWCRGKAKESTDRKWYGRKNYAAGWCFWCPGIFNGQSIGIHEAGARAFRDSLAHELQIQVEVGSRLD